jgi:hypothetical protein
VTTYTHSSYCEISASINQLYMLIATTATGKAGQNRHPMRTPCWKSHHTMTHSSPQASHLGLLGLPSSVGGAGLGEISSKLVYITLYYTMGAFYIT